LRERITRSHGGQIPHAVAVQGKLLKPGHGSSEKITCRAYSAAAFFGASRNVK
jgi:hypothetical protein